MASGVIKNRLITWGTNLCFDHQQNSTVWILAHRSTDYQTPELGRGGSLLLLQSKQKALSFRARGFYFGSYQPNAARGDLISFPRFLPW